MAISQYSVGMFERLGRTFVLLTLLFGPFTVVMAGAPVADFSASTVVPGAHDLVPRAGGSSIPMGKTSSWNSTDSDQRETIALGDIDNDGDLDLIVGTIAGFQLRMYTTDEGRLSSTVAWSSNEKEDTESVALGDYDGDGDLDLAVGNNNMLEAQKNRVYRNDNGTLTSNSVWASDENDMTMSVAWGDIDMDGDLDLVAGNYGRVRLYRNDNGQLTNGSVWNSSASFAVNQLALGDFDKDGDLDLALGNGAGNNVNSIIKNVNGKFQDFAFWNSTEADETTDIAWVDYDKDGDLDLAAANWGPPFLRLYKNNNGVIGNTAAWSSTGPMNARSMVWGDFDNDGDQDVAIGNYNNNITIYRNDNGVLTSYSAWNSTEWDDTRSLACGDIDMDGDIDLVAGGPSKNRLYRNTYNAFFGRVSWTSSEVNATRAVALGDYDKDGDLDLAAGNTNMFGQNMLYKNNNGVLTSSAFWMASRFDYTQTIAWVDYDNDNDLDLSIGTSDWSGGGRLRLYRNDNGALTSLPVWNSTEGMSTQAIAWGDYDKDGDLDLIAGNAGMWGERNQLYRNDNGKMTDKPVWNSTETDYTYAVAWGDCDNDGDLDLAVGNSNGVNRIYRNDNGNISLKGTWSSAELDNTESVAWGDYDNDGDLDLAVGNMNAKNRIYRNDGGVLKAEAAWSSVESDNTYAVVWADMDNDGDLDLVAGNNNAPNRIYRNNYGVIEQTAAWNASASEGTASVAVGDIDKDGDPDIAIGTIANPNKVYENRMGSLPNSIPRVTLPPLKGHFKGDIRLNYTAYDPEGNPVTISPYFSADGGQTWKPATKAKGSEGTKLLAASPSGKAHYFTWDSDADHVNSTNCMFKMFVMDLPSVGGFQKIAYSKMTSSITVTNYWPRYIGGIASQIVNEDTVWKLDLDDHFKDDDDPAGLTYDFEDTGSGILDQELSIDPSTHIVTWAPAHGDENLKDIVFKAIDAQGHVGTAPAIILFYQEVNEPPLFNGSFNQSLRLHDAVVPEDSKWSVDLDDYFWDEEKDAGLIFTANSSSVRIDPVTHVASWEPVHGSPSVNNLVFSAMDADDTMMTVSSLPINLTYAEVNDQWPVYVGGLGDTLVYEDTTWAIDLDTAFYDEESNPQLFDGSLSFSCSQPDIEINETTHIASWTPGHGNSSLFSLTFMAHDPLRPWRNATSPPITLYYVEVNDQRPMLLVGLPNETSVDEDSTWAVNLGDHFYDEEGGNALVYRSDSPMVTIDPYTHVASWRPAHGSKDLALNLTAVDPLNLNWSVSHQMILRYREVNDEPPAFRGGLQGAIVPEDTTWTVDLDDYFSDEEGARLAFSTTHEAITINNTTHVANWTPIHGSGTLVPVRFMAFDGKFTTETAPITLTYQEVNDQPPVYQGGLKNASSSNQRVWKVDLDNYFTDEEYPGGLIFTCNKKEVKIDPITHEATWSPENDKVTSLKNVVFTAHDPEKANQVVVSEALSLKVPAVVTDYIIQIGPIGLTILDTLAYGFSGLSFIVGIYYSTKKMRLTKKHKENIKKTKDITKLKAYYKKKIRPDIEAEKVTPVQGIVLKDAVEERAIKLKRRSGEEVDLDEDAKTTPSSEDIEKMDEGADVPVTPGPAESEEASLPDDKGDDAAVSEEE